MTTEKDENQTEEPVEPETDKTVDPAAEETAEAKADGGVAPAEETAEPAAEETTLLEDSVDSSELADDGPDGAPGLPDYYNATNFYLGETKPKARKKNMKVIVALAVALVAAGGGVGFYLYNSYTTAQAQAKAEAKAKAKAEEDAATDEAAKKTYESLRSDYDDIMATVAGDYNRDSSVAAVGSLAELRTRVEDSKDDLKDHSGSTAYYDELMKAIDDSTNELNAKIADDINNTYNGLVVDVSSSDVTKDDLNDRISQLQALKDTINGNQVIIGALGGQDAANEGIIASIDETIATYQSKVSEIEAEEEAAAEAEESSSSSSTSSNSYGTGTSGSYGGYSYGYGGTSGTTSSGTSGSTSSGTTTSGTSGSTSEGGSSETSGSSSESGSSGTSDTSTDAGGE